jgi:hypothetical protein
MQHGDIAMPHLFDLLDAALFLTVITIATVSLPIFARFAFAKIER